MQRFPLYAALYPLSYREVVAIEHKTTLENPRRHLQQNRHKSYFAVNGKKDTTILISDSKPVKFAQKLRVFRKFLTLKGTLLHNLISANQFGFLPGRSSCSQLLSVFNCWFYMLDTHKTFNVIYTGIAKAFDSATYSKVLNVLLSYGIDGKVLDWINCFLYNRVQSIPYVSITAILIVYLCIAEFLKAVS